MSQDAPFLPLSLSLSFSSDALKTLKAQRSLVCFPHSKLLITHSCFSLSAPKSFSQFVGGKPGKSVSGRSVAVRAPGGGSVLAYCPDGGRKDVRNAVEAAVKVQAG